MNTQFPVRLGSTIRLLLVDAETEARLLGCVICGPSFIVRCGDLPSALIKGLELQDVSSYQISILATTPNEVSLGLKSEDKSEAVFSAEARVVFIERDDEDPGGCLMEGNVLILQASTKDPNRAIQITAATDVGDTAQFRCVYARSDELGLFWYKSRSEFLMKGNILGGFAFADLVVVRQCSRHFDFDSPDFRTSFNSSIEFVFRTGPPLIMALSFPFPLVLWLYCVHASLGLPRISLLLSETGNWSLSMVDGFSLASPLLIDCFEVLASSNKLGITLANGCGGTILDSVVPDNQHDVLRNARRLDERKHASGYPRAARPSVPTLQVPTRNLKGADDASFRQTESETAEFTIEMEEGTVVASSIGGSTTSFMTPKGSTLPIALSIGETNSRELPKKFQVRTAPFATVSTLDKEPSILGDSSTDLEFAKDISSGDLILRIESQWVMHWDWRETQALLMELKSKRPIKLLVARCKSLGSLAHGPAVVLRSKQVQLILSSSVLEQADSRGQTPIAVRVSQAPEPRDSELQRPSSVNGITVLEMDSRDARRRAATRQLFRRQTDRLDPFHATQAGLSGGATMNECDADGASHKTSKARPASTIASDSGRSSHRETADSIGESDTKLGGLAHRMLKSAAGTTWNLPSALAKTKSKDEGLKGSTHDAKADRWSGARPVSSANAVKGGAASIAKPPSLILAPALEQLLSDDNIAKREEAAQLLLLLTSDKLNKRTLGPLCISALIKACTDDQSDIVHERCAGALWNLSDDPENALAIARQGGVQALTRILMRSENVFAKEEACGALWTLAEDETNVPLIVLSGALGPLVTLLTGTWTTGSGSDFLEENASGCIWTLSSSAGAQKILREDARTLNCMMRMIKDGSYVTKENALGVLVNMFLSAENTEMRRAFLDDRGAQKLVHAIMFGRSEPVKRNACACLAALAKHSRDASIEFASEGAMTALLKFLLQAQENSSRISAAEGIRVLAEIPENALQLSELGSVPEVLRMLEQARKSRGERKVLEKDARIRASVAVDANIHPEDMLNAKRYVHFDSAVLDAGLEQLVGKPGSNVERTASGRVLMRVGSINVDLG